MFKNPSTRISDFDQYILAPMFGYKDKEEYYKSCSFSDKLHKIKSCPVMFLVTKNDFLVDKDSFPYEEIKKNPMLLLAYTNEGGHCCFLESSDKILSTTFPMLNMLSWLFPTQGWFKKPMIEFIVAIENIKSHEKKQK